MEIVALSGSQRPGSLNTRLLAGVGALVPPSASYRVLSGLERLPFYDPAMEEAPPAVAVALREAVGAADAVLIASPELNHSFSALIKNAIEWLSRPTVELAALTDKPVALLGAAPGRFGTVRAQAHLRQVLWAAGAVVLARPEVFVTEAETKLGERGEVLDPVARELIVEVLDNLARLVRQSAARVSLEGSSAR